MKIKELTNAPQWLIDAVVENEDVTIDEDGRVQWYSGKWLSGDFRGGNFCGGDFCGGDFWGGDFRGGNFRGGDFRGGAIKIKPQTLYGLRWRIIIVDDRMEIGCQRHTHAQWKKFSDADIGAMDSYALEFWKENKSFLLAACSAHAKRAKRIAKERAALTTDKGEV